MSIRIGGSASEPEPPRSAAQSIGEGVGCLLSCIGVALLLWALAGFPGFAR